MPIRINLLAEAQAEEELRRKDPVKRSLWAAGLIVSLVLLWGLTIQLRLMHSKRELSQLQTRWKGLEKNYAAAVESQRKLLEAEHKLAALDQLTTNRFLWGTALNACQLTLNGIEDVQVMRLKTEQAFLLTEETKARTNGTQVIPAKPGVATEKITMTIEAMDSGVPPGGHVNRFKENIAQVPYFKQNLQKTNGVLLTTLSPPQTGQNTSKSFVMFTLQCFFPERVRN